MAQISKIGYAQVEPNRLNAQRTKQVFGQLPLDAGITVAQNGMALVYDQVAGKVKLPVKGGAAMLHMSEIILEDPRASLDHDFAIHNRPESLGQVAMAGYPRLYALSVGDKFITNAVHGTTAAVAAGTQYIAGADGFWEPKGDTTPTGVVLEVVKDTVLPDGQRGLQFVVVSVGGN